MKRLICLSLSALIVLEGATLSLSAQQIVTAQVTSVSGSRLTIDQGALRGLKPGSEGVIYFLQNVADRTVRLEVALARVVSVNNDSAQLMIIDSTAPVEQGYLVDFWVTTGAPGTVQAKTEKKSGSKWWIWLIVAAAGGGAAAALASKKSSSTPPPAPTTGTFTIHLPAN